MAASSSETPRRDEELEQKELNGDASNEDAKGQLSQFGPAPDGGATAWLCAAGASCTFFCCLGFANSFGAFAEYYSAHQMQDESADAIAWVGSLAAFLQFFGGSIGGPLFDRFGAKVIWPSALLYVFAMMMLSLCKNYWQIMLTQGVLMGIAMGLLQFPAMAAVAQWFDKKRGAAIGLAIAGSSIGGIVIPIAVSKMLNNSSLGFGWSVRIIGFVILPLVAFALLTIKQRLPSRQTDFFMPSAFKSARLDMLIASMFFSFMGMFMPLFFIPTYAVHRGMGATLAGYLLAILNASSTFGRVIPGILADKYGKLNVYSIGTLATGIVVFCMNSAKSNAALIVYSVVFGFTSGTIISGASVSFTICVEDPRNIGTVSGMGMAVGALGGLIGPPLSGVFVDHYESFFQTSMFSGAVCILGAILGFLTKMTTPEGLWGRV